MRNKIAKSMAAAVLAVSIVGSTNLYVYADEVTDLKNQKSEAQSQLDSLQNQMAYLLTQMDELQNKIYDKTDEIDKANTDLADAQKKLEGQYSDMKLRIKYMYEDQSTSIAEALITADDMSDALNKSEYVQQIYNYDRSKLEEMNQTAASIKKLKEDLENDKNQLQTMSDDMTKKQALLYTTINDQKGKVADFDEKLNKAVEVAAAKSAAEEARRQQVAAAQASNNTSSNSSTGKTSNTGSIAKAASSGGGNSSIAAKAVSIALSQQGVPYVSGGSSPSGFDCSGLTSYAYAQCGISLPRSSGAQAGGGVSVGSLANAQPGDIICYPGHVAMYIGGGKIVHAPVPGDKVKIASANIMTITSIRRYW